MKAHRGLAAPLLWNALVALVLSPGVLLAAARFVTMIPIPAEERSTLAGLGGYPGDEHGAIALVTLPFSLAIQYIAVRLALKGISARLLRHRHFLYEVWNRTFHYGIPLLSLVFCYDICTIWLDAPDDRWELMLPLAWSLYCYGAAYRWAMRHLRSRAVLITPLCHECGYRLHGLPGVVCPECGVSRDGAPHRAARLAWPSPVNRVARTAARLLGIIVIVSAAGGLCYNGATFTAGITGGSNEPSPAFLYVLYPLLVVSSACYVALLVIGIQFLLLQMSAIRWLTRIILIETAYFVALVVLGFLPGLAETGILDAPAIIAGGFMYQLIPLLPLWGPLLGYWAERRLDVGRQPVDEQGFTEATKVARGFVDGIGERG